MLNAHDALVGSAIAYASELDSARPCLPVLRMLESNILDKAAALGREKLRAALSTEPAEAAR